MQLPEDRGGQEHRKSKREIAPWYWDKEQDPPLYGLVLVEKKGRWCFVNPYGWTIYKLPEEVVSIDFLGYDGGTIGTAFGPSGWWCIFGRRGRIIMEGREYDGFYW